MKTYLTIVIVLVLGSAAFAQSSRTIIGKQKPVRATSTPPPITQREKIDGAIPRGVRGGNPLQMLNPQAPAKYGTSLQNVVYDPVTGRFIGVKFFEIFF